jgi:hypothetical protein
MISLTLLFLTHPSFSKLPERLPMEEIQKYYEPFESQGLKLKDYGAKGLGFELLKNVEPGSVVLCINNSQKLFPYDPYELSDYVSDLDEVTQIKVKVLYYKFMSTSSDFLTIYIKSMSNNFFHYGQWTPEHRQLFENLTLIDFYYQDPTGEEEFSQIKAALAACPNLPADMLEYESYMWANYVVKSRFYTYNSPDGDIFVMIPVLDIPNHYPNPAMYRDSSFFTLTQDLDCVNSYWHQGVGDEFLYQYSIHNSLVFLLGYDIVLENNPYDYVYYNFAWISEEGENKTNEFEIYADRTNMELLELLLSIQGDEIETRSSFVKTWNDLEESEEDKVIEALAWYRRLVVEYQESWRLGIREVRREAEGGDYVSGRIWLYGISTRTTVYNHLRAMDQDLLFALHYKLLNGS